MDSRQRTRISKFLSKHLRHQPERLGLTLAAGGWVNVAVPRIVQMADPGVASEIAALNASTGPSMRIACSIGSHGGAIATLADLTVMAAAWCAAAAPPELRGVTVSMTLDFMAPARATDVIGVGRVLRRGRSLTNCEAEIVDPSGTLVAKALATYKVG